MSPKFFYSACKKYKAEQYNTNKATFWLWVDGTIRGRIFLREEGLEMELYKCESFTSDEIIAILSLAKTVHDGCKTLPLEPTSKQLRTDKDY